jgi:CRP-like cAMP-binding protein
MHSTHPPSIRRVTADEIVMAEGVPGTTISLILDGVFSVSALGEEIAEIGPGVVIGEGAAIGAGLRRATVVAKTNGTLAEVPAADVSAEALRALADQHRLDELDD